MTLNFDYVTDGGLALNGFAMDNAKLTVDGKVAFSDDAEGASAFKLDGFVQSNGMEFKSTTTIWSGETTKGLIKL